MLQMAKKGFISSFIISPLMFIAFLVLKLTKVINWHWFIVVSPLMAIPFGIVGLAFVKMLIKLNDMGADE